MKKGTYVLKKGVLKSIIIYFLFIFAVCGFFYLCITDDIEYKIHNWSELAGIILFVIMIALIINLISSVPIIKNTIYKFFDGKASLSSFFILS